MGYRVYAFINFNFEKLLSELATDTGNVANMRNPINKFGTLFSNLC
jgi:hypothetical protein